MKYIKKVEKIILNIIINIKLRHKNNVLLCFSVFFFDAYNLYICFAHPLLIMLFYFEIGSIYFLAHRDAYGIF